MNLPRKCRSAAPRFDGRATASPFDATRTSEALVRVPAAEILGIRSFHRIQKPESLSAARRNFIFAPSGCMASSARSAVRQHWRRPLLGAEAAHHVISTVVAGILVTRTPRSGNFKIGAVVAGTVERPLEHACA